MPVAFCPGGEIGYFTQFFTLLQAIGISISLIYREIDDWHEFRSSNKVISEYATDRRAARARFGEHHENTR